MSRPLREIPPRLVKPTRVAREAEDPSEARESRIGPDARIPDSVAQTDFAAEKQAVGKRLLSIPPPNRNFEGVPNLDGFYPPDTVGDVGPNHYVQWVLKHFQIFDKNGTSLYGPAPSNTLWSGFGGPCETGINGDPFVVYDPISDRWFFSQHTMTSPFGQCVAVSVGADPLGSYYRYFFSLSATLNYDYPKFGVWPDGYYMTGNKQDTTRGYAFVGSAALVFDRAKMLLGQPATYQEFSLPGFGYLPTDLDGRLLPPRGSPNYLVHQDPTSLVTYRLHVDWSTPANSALSAPTSLPSAAYNLLCPGTSSCVPQPGTSVGLDGLGSYPMHRFAYRNFGDHESLVFNLSVDASAAPPVHAAVRWYELRNTPPGGATTLYQQGTYAPDAVHRWMGSVAMDAAGDIALGYSVSNATSVFPGIRYTGRVAADPLGTMPQGEASIVEGSGSQLGPANRWGDYSTMTVDPSDDCTFWYTNEYNPTTSDAPWRTRIASFRFPGCSACVPPAAPTIAGPAVICAGSPFTSPPQPATPHISGTTGRRRFRVRPRRPTRSPAPPPATREPIS